MNERAATKLANSVAAHTEEAQLEAVVSILGERRAQAAVHSHSLPELVAKEQNRGIDYRAGAA